MFVRNLLTRFIASHKALTFQVAILNLLSFVVLSEILSTDLLFKVFREMSSIYIILFYYLLAGFPLF